VFTTSAVTHPNLPSELPLDLNCLVLGDDIFPVRIFSVKISKTEKVDALKKAIKKEKEPEFDDYAADRLDLQRVSIPDDRSLKENISNLDFDDEQSLSPMDKLSKVFADAPEESPPYCR
jgi:hypothetical protein